MKGQTLTHICLLHMGPLKVNWSKYNLGNANKPQLNYSDQILSEIQIQSLRIPHVYLYSTFPALNKCITLAQLSLHRLFQQVLAHRETRHRG